MSSEIVITYISHITAVEDSNDMLLDDLAKSANVKLNEITEILGSGKYFVSQISTCTAIITGAVLHYTTLVLFPDEQKSGLVPTKLEDLSPKAQENLRQAILERTNEIRQGKVTEFPENPYIDKQ